jgi:hypothetical protein
MIDGKNWDAYHQAGFEDKPLTKIIAVVRALRNSGATVIGLTARPEKWRQETIRWLVTNGCPMDEILMRPEGNHMPSPQVKVMLARQRFGDLSEITVVIDDREDVCSAFVAEGVSAFRCVAVPR